MPSLPPSLINLTLLAVTMLSLAIVSRQISIHIQTVIFYITRSPELPAVGLFLIFLPGVLVHESAHWAMARLLGLKTGKFRVWPRRQGQTIGMGSVTVQQGGVWLDSLVGLAPLLAGSILITLIARHVFAAHRLTDALLQGDLWAGLGAFLAGLRAVDGALWAYLLFAIANAMMPSPSDREPLKPILLYLSLAGLLYLVFGLPRAPLTSALEHTVPALQALSSALIFTLLLDLAILIILLLVETIISPRQT